MLCAFWPRKAVKNVQSGLHFLSPKHGGNGPIFTQNSQGEIQQRELWRMAWQQNGNLSCFGKTAPAVRFHKDSMWSLGTEACWCFLLTIFIGWRSSDGLSFMLQASQWQGRAFQKHHSAPQNLSVWPESSHVTKPSFQEKGKLPSLGFLAVPTENLSRLKLESCCWRTRRKLNICCINSRLCHIQERSSLVIVHRRCSELFTGVTWSELLRQIKRRAGDMG